MPMRTLWLVGKMLGSRQLVLDLVQLPGLVWELLHHLLPVDEEWARLIWVERQGLSCAFGTAGKWKAKMPPTLAAKDYDFHTGKMY